MSRNILGIFDEGDISDIGALIEKLERSSFDYLCLEGNGVKVTIGKNAAARVDDTTAVRTVDAARASGAAAGVAAAQAGDAAAPAATGDAAARTGDAARPADTAPAGDAAAPMGNPAASASIPAADAADAIPDENAVIVRAPSYGLFYCQPSPGAPPYVKIGDIVKKGDTLGLVEIMKTFNAIAADADGEIIAIYAKNEEQLKPGQPLFAIRV